MLSSIMLMKKKGKKPHNQTLLFIHCLLATITIRTFLNGRPWIACCVSESFLLHEKESKKMFFEVVAFWSALYVLERERDAPLAEQ